MQKNPISPLQYSFLASFIRTTFQGVSWFDSVYWVPRKSFSKEVWWMVHFSDRCGYSHFALELLGKCSWILAILQGFRKHQMHARCNKRICTRSIPTNVSAQTKMWSLNCGTPWTSSKRRNTPFTFGTLRAIKTERQHGRDSTYKRHRPATAQRRSRQPTSSGILA